MLGLETARQTYRDFGDNLLELSKYSTAKAELEEKQGGTCDGNRVAAKGVRYKQRTEDATKAKSYADFFSGHFTTVETSIDTLKTGLGEYQADQVMQQEQQINATNREANALWGSGRRVELFQWLEDRIEKGRTGFERDGVSFKCPDAIFESLGQSVLNVSYTPLPNQIDLFNSKNGKESIRLIWGNLFLLPVDVLKWLVSTPIERAKMETLQMIFIQPLLLGIVIDLLIFLAALNLKMSDPAVKAVAKAVSPYIYPWENRYYLIVPTPNKDPDLRRFLMHPRLRLVHNSARFKDLPYWYRFQYAAQGGDKTARFLVYEVPRQVVRDLSST